MKRLGTAQPIKMEAVEYPERIITPKPAPKGKKRTLEQKKVQPLPALQDEPPSFTTETQFLMPDGSSFE
jgi:hypothetical protein